MSDKPLMLRGRPVAAQNTASARRWLAKIIRDVDMSEPDLNVLLSSINILADLEIKAINGG
jgi:hypothetical protein